ncbi:hypothetical protein METBISCDRAFT_20935 [Metschnikowia bicuspidata]|uniref:Stress response protein NST1 n=1 Tax=Metschnikowia bicuspidata TaxID=27322 RepID=A0A4P9ZIM9_9ASCO|nr:hypothetical protein METBISCDRAFT_20935 [Metschnikowia bicuspidata]
MCAAPVDRTPTQYTNGLDLHFDYGGDAPQTAKKRKKKKKKKLNVLAGPASLSRAGRAAMAIPFSAVDLRNPDADYPENRVIKIGLNGDLIVERLDNDDTVPLGARVDAGSAPDHALPARPLSAHTLTTPFLEHLKSLDLERSVFNFKIDAERLFWNNMSPEERQQILNVDTDMIMARFRLKRGLASSRADYSYGAACSGENQYADSACSCCGQNMAMVREEMENMYIPHLQDFLKSHWLADGAETANSSENIPHTSSEDPSKRLETEASLDGSKVSKTSPHHAKAGKPPSETSAASSENGLSSSVDANGAADQFARLENVKRMFGNYQEHPNPDFREIMEHVLKYFAPSMLGDLDSSPFYSLEFVECLFKYSGEGKGALPKAIAELKSRYLSEDSNLKLAAIAKEISSFADMLINDEGQDFINMIEYIKGESAPGSYGREAQEYDDETEDHSNSVDAQGHVHDAYPEDEQVESRGCEHFTEESSEESDGEDDEENENYVPQDHLEERYAELHGLFMLEVIHLIRHRFQVLYEKKISEDRTRQFIEELEAEENARKENELRKLRQKEEQREKKRLQQQAKEDERKRLLEADRKKAAALKQQQEAMRAEQIRRKEEIRLKKLQEKEKKIEALQKKEEQKRLEQQRLEEEKRRVESLASALEKTRLSSLPVPEIKTSPSAPSAKPRSIPATTAAIASVSAGKAPVSAVGAGLPTPTAADSDVSSNTTSAPPTASTMPPGLQNTITASTNHLLEQLYQSQPALALPTSQPSAFDNLMAPPVPTHPQRQNQPMTQPQMQSGPMQDLWGPTNPTGTLWGSSYPRNPSLSSIWGNTATTGWIPALGLAAAASAPLPPSPGFLPHQVHSQVHSQQVHQIHPQTPLQTLCSVPALLAGHAPLYAPLDVMREPIRAAAIEAFQILTQNNQLHFGAAGALVLFQLVKNVLQRTNLPYSEFLRLLNASGNAVFDFVYDDFGSVTHIRLSQLGMANVSLEMSLHGATFCKAKFDVSAAYSADNDSAPDRAYSHADPLKSLESFPVQEFGFEEPKRQIW